MTSFGQAYRQLDVAYAMHRKQKSDEPQPDGGGKDGGDSDVTPVTPEA